MQMFPDEQLESLIERVHERTLEGKLIWTRTGEEGVYLAAVPDASMSISAQWNPEYENDDYHLRIYNANGDLVDDIVDTQFPRKEGKPPMYEVMGVIYTRARRQAMGADKTIAALLRALGQ